MLRSLTLPVLYRRSGRFPIHAYKAIPAFGKMNFPATSLGRRSLAGPISSPKSCLSEDHGLSFFQIAFRHLGVDAVRDPDCDPPRLRSMIGAERPDNA